MWPLPAGYPITTPYGRRGPYWSCNPTAAGGVHTGCDMACPVGTPLLAAVAGTIRHRAYGASFGGRQFAISPSAGQPFAGGEVFYAHGCERLPDGTPVEAGQQVGLSGAEGNVSGPHLHFEYHPTSQNVWSCWGHADPAPVLEHAGQAPAGEPEEDEDMPAFTVIGAVDREGPAAAVAPGYHRRLTDEERQSLVAAGLARDEIAWVNGRQYDLVLDVCAHPDPA